MQSAGGQSSTQLHLSEMSCSHTPRLRLCSPGMKLVFSVMGCHLKVARPVPEDALCTWGKHETCHKR